ncbi:isoleucine--tRNA ligase [Algimonas porphyrae]|uniref:Isoleucine--tRNA ligase n=1 Tax=Algimonas porphyrae TaxID=1128113 RepID=A0ABQ5UZL3_9PROT|nr:isoleucine--tRNA ligase [Algimonas porphyrae]GLQ19874.1 isoleucine--tRNA ligase [Algimonas porphyrae]
MTDSPRAPETRDYRDTLFLPKTDFPMRAGLPKAEPEWLKQWQAMNLYAALRKRSKGRPQYCLHDGPPYANGHIHMGTALNKIHKDMVNRSHQMAGYDANYVPGWDCHGLPIEWKVEEEFRSKGRSKDDVPASEFRARCREYAQEWLDVQREEFKRLGVVGDWDNPYVTMKPESEADICAELLKIAGTGQLYRGSKPIMWSPVEQTALAEAEVEYHDKKGTQIYVRFPVRGFKYTSQTGTRPALDLASASIAIWTTTPWTIPANRAVSYSDTISYDLYEITELGDPGFPLGQAVGDRLIVADKLWDDLAKASHITSSKRLRAVEADELSAIILSHPLAGTVDSFDYPIPLLPGDHVTDDAGTGFVHTAPSHGEDDFNVWMSNTDKIEALGADSTVPMTLDDAGCYTSVVGPRFEGLDVIRTSGKKRGQDGKANAEVIKALVEAGNLLARAPITVRDAHSWRSKAPVLRRATPQWFISMSKGNLRETALAEIDKTTFYPERGRNRLRTMVEDRPDWLVSRQRAWGVPITILVDADGNLHTDRDDADAINARILAAVRKQGVDGWFDTPAENFMGGEAGWTKVTDILDVWFDSGCTHAFCLKQRDDLPDRADLYLEGSDQHRGWFQSSLLESCAVYGEAPYKAVMTDGFVVDEKGLKMSKSLGNTVSPQDIAKQFGVDILRLWVASSDVHNDLKIGKDIIQTNVDAYRKLRNTLRYLVGALDGYDAADAVSYDDMPALERWVLHQLHAITGKHKDWVANHEHRRIYSELFNFCTNDLSAFYFDIRKDALYCDPLDSTRRRACRTVMAAIFERLTTWLAPILAFTMEEVWQTRHDSSVHLEDFRNAPERWENAALAHHMDQVRSFRDSVNEAIEPLRRDKVIKSSLEARVIAPTGDLVATLDALGVSRNDVYADPTDPSDVLADYLIVSEADLAGDSVVVEDLKDSAATKCARSWKYFRGEGEITPRDAAAVAALDTQ